MGWSGRLGAKLWHIGLFIQQHPSSLCSHYTSLQHFLAFYLSVSVFVFVSGFVFRSQIMTHWSFYPTASILPFSHNKLFFTFFAIVNFKYLCFLSLYAYLSLCFEPYYMQHVNIHPFLARTVLLHNILLPFAVFHDMCLNLFTFFSLLCRVVENMFSFF